MLISKYYNNPQNIKESLYNNIQPHDAVPSLSSNGSKVLKWMLRCHGLLQGPMLIVIQAPATAAFLYRGPDDCNVWPILYIFAAMLYEIWCCPATFLSNFSENSQETSHILPVRARYGMSFVSLSSLSMICYAWYFFEVRVVCSTSIQLSW